jgi:hypothetical protein
MNYVPLLRYAQYQKNACQPSSSTMCIRSHMLVRCVVVASVFWCYILRAGQPREAFRERYRTVKHSRLVGRCRKHEMQARASHLGCTWGGRRDPAWVTSVNDECCDYLSLGTPPGLRAEVSVHTASVMMPPIVRGRCEMAVNRISLLNQRSTAATGCILDCGRAKLPTLCGMHTFLHSTANH